MLNTRQCRDSETLSHFEILKAPDHEMYVCRLTFLYKNNIKYIKILLWNVFQDFFILIFCYQKNAHTIFTFRLQLAVHRPGMQRASYFSHFPSCVQLLQSVPALTGTSTSSHPSVQEERSDPFTSSRHLFNAYLTCLHLTYMQILLHSL